MIEILIYLLKANAMLILCLAIYHFLLRNLSFHQWKRAYLLFSIMLITIGPTLVWKKYTTVTLPNISTIGINDKPLQQVNEPNSDVYLNYLYLTLFFIIIFGTLTYLYKLYKSYKALQTITKQATIIDQENRVYHHREIEVAFSTWNKIYINKHHIAPNDYNTIILHERQHINQYHSLDKWLIQMIKAIFWYNPLMKYFINSINENHEWIVDERMSSNMNTQTYQLKLLQYQQYNKHIDLASQFAISNLKKRILFMNQNKSAKWKLGFFATSFCVLISASVAMAYQNVTTITYSQATINAIDNVANLDTTIQKTQKSVTNVEQKNAYLIIVDGNEMDELAFMEKIQQQNIASKKVLDATDGQKKYGDKGANGVIEITLHKNDPNNKPEGFTKVTSATALEIDTIIVKTPDSDGFRLQIVEPSQTANATTKTENNNKQPINVYIDGIISNEEITRISPQHIESMDVIKNENTIKITIKKEFKHLYNSKQ